MSNFGDVRSIVQAHPIDALALLNALATYDDNVPAAEVVAYVRHAWGWCPASMWGKHQRFCNVLASHDAQLKAHVQVGMDAVLLGVVRHPWSRLQAHLMPERREAHGAWPAWLEAARELSTDRWRARALHRIPERWREIMVLYESAISNPEGMSDGGLDISDRCADLYASIRPLMDRFGYPPYGLKRLYGSLHPDPRMRSHVSSKLLRRLELALSKEVQP